MLSCYSVFRCLRRYSPLWLYCFDLCNRFDPPVYSRAFTIPLYPSLLIGRRGEGRITNTRSMTIWILPSFCANCTPNSTHLLVPIYFAKFFGWYLTLPKVTENREYILSNPSSPDLTFMRLLRPRQLWLILLIFLILYLFLHLIHPPYLPTLTSKHKRDSNSHLKFELDPWRS